MKDLIRDYRTRHGEGSGAEPSAVVFQTAKQQYPEYAAVEPAHRQSFVKLVNAGRAARVEPLASAIDRLITSRAFRSSSKARQSTLRS